MNSIEMNSIERIRHTIDLQENQKELESKKAFVEKEIKKNEAEVLINQNTCFHIVFRYNYGVVALRKETSKCLLCNKGLDSFQFDITHLKVEANMSKYGSDISRFQPGFWKDSFHFFQNKFLELSEKYPDKDSSEIVEMLNKMLDEILDKVLTNDGQKGLIQSLDELQTDEKTLGMKKDNNTSP